MHGARRTLPRCVVTAPSHLEHATRLVIVCLLAWTWDDGVPHRDSLAERALALLGILRSSSSSSHSPSNLPEFLALARQLPVARNAPLDRAAWVDCRRHFHTMSAPMPSSCATSPRGCPPLRRPDCFELGLRTDLSPSSARSTLRPEQSRATEVSTEAGEDQAAPLPSRCDSGDASLTNSSNPSVAHTVVSAFVCRPTTPV